MLSVSRLCRSSQKTLYYQNVIYCPRPLQVVIRNNNNRKSSTLVNLATYAQPVVNNESITSLKLCFAPFYRVLLHNPEEYSKIETIHRLKKAVPVIELKSAIQIVGNAVRYGSSIVITCILEEADAYASRMKVAGLKSSIEPA